MIELSLPYPPSANRLWRSVQGRNIKSAEYRRWLDVAVREAVYACPGFVSGPYEINMIAERPDRRQRDLGNLEKPLSDALVSAGIVSDDKHAQVIRIAWSDRKPDKSARVQIQITPLEIAA